MPSIFIVAAVAVVFQIFTLGAMRAREAISVSAAKQATKLTEQAACQVRVDQVARSHDEAVAVAGREATEAANQVAATSTVPAEIKTLCLTDDSCRSRFAP